MFGGAISAAVGSDVWSYISFGSPSSISLDTRCIKCHMHVTNVSISKSSVLSSSAFSQGVFVRMKLFCALSLHLTESVQVSGGSISFFIGANLWSSNAVNGLSELSAGGTIVSGLLAIFRNCSVSGSRASTSTSSGTRMFCFSVPHNVPNVSALGFSLNGHNQVLSATLGWPHLQVLS